MHNLLELRCPPKTIKPIHIFQIKHVRGILFDDVEKSNRGSQASSQSNAKNQSIHLEIKAVKFLKPTSAAATTHKKANVTQDDSVLNYKVSTKESNNRGGNSNK